MAILGSTGSIGEQAIEVCLASECFDVVALSASSSVEKLVRQAEQCQTDHLYVAGDASVQGYGKHVFHESWGDLLDAAEPDLVINSVVGVAGLLPSIETLRRGIDLALANKETLVAGGYMVTELAKQTQARIIPVDSEHSALQQCMADVVGDNFDALILTASGGPFRGFTSDDLSNVTLAQALRHPTWNMGGKITIDSATLMNKALEVIEAAVLFGVNERRIEVVVHPDSIVHALVRNVDGSLIAHLGWPDMRVPISWALHWPCRKPVAGVRNPDLLEMPPLIFERPDEDTFVSIALAREALRTGGAAPCVLNAANEVAVEAFMQERIGFRDIYSIVQTTLENYDYSQNPETFDDVLLHDRQARKDAASVLNLLA